MRSLIPDALRAVRRSPRVSLVSPVYGVAPYLPRFLDSLDAQDYPHDRLQVVLVLDGACDDSPRAPGPGEQTSTSRSLRPTTVGRAGPATWEWSTREETG